LENKVFNFIEFLIKKRKVLEHDFKRLKDGHDRHIKHMDKKNMTILKSNKSCPDKFYFMYKYRILNLFTALLMLVFNGCSFKKDKVENDQKWLGKIEKLQIAIEKNFKIKRLPYELLGPANQKEINKIEQQMNMKIPNELKKFFLSESKYAYMNWIIPEDYEMPSDIEFIRGGGIEIGLKILPEMNKMHTEIIKKYYNNQNSQYDRSLHNKFVFHTTWSGDFFAIDLDESNFGKVLYLSYEDAPAHNYILGDSFSEFIDNWTQLGFVGPEGLELLYFIDNNKSGLNPHCRNAVLLKQMINE